MRLSRDFRKFIYQTHHGIVVATAIYYFTIPPEMFSLFENVKFFSIFQLGAIQSDTGTVFDVYLRSSIMMDTYKMLTFVVMAGDGQRYLKLG